MLLTVYNLPSNYTYNDVKLLMSEKCGLTDLVLDNLMVHGNGRKVTVGLVDDVDAAILVRRINGIYLNGEYLYVEESKKKRADIDQPYRSTEKIHVQEPSNRFSNDFQQSATYTPNYFAPNLSITSMQQQSMMGMANLMDYNTASMGYVVPQVSIFNQPAQAYSQPSATEHMYELGFEDQSSNNRDRSLPYENPDRRQEPVRDSRRRKNPQSSQRNSETTSRLPPRQPERRDKRDSYASRSAQTSQRDSGRSNQRLPPRESERWDKRVSHDHKNAHTSQTVPKPTNQWLPPRESERWDEREQQGRKNTHVSKQVPEPTNQWLPRKDSGRWVKPSTLEETNNWKGQSHGKVNSWNDQTPVEAPGHRGRSPNRSTYQSFTRGENFDYNTRNDFEHDNNVITSRKRRHDYDDTGRGESQDQKDYNPWNNTSESDTSKRIKEIDSELENLRQSKLSEASSWEKNNEYIQYDNTHQQSVPNLSKPLNSMTTEPRFKQPQPTRASAPEAAYLRFRKGATKFASPVASFPTRYEKPVTTIPKSYPQKPVAAAPKSYQPKLVAAVPKTYPQKSVAEPRLYYPQSQATKKPSHLSQDLDALEQSRVSSRKSTAVYEIMRFILNKLKKSHLLLNKESTFYRVMKENLKRRVDKVVALRFEDNMDVRPYDIFQQYLKMFSGKSFKSYFKSISIVTERVEAGGSITPGPKTLAKKPQSQSTASAAKAEVGYPAFGTRVESSKRVKLYPCFEKALEKELADIQEKYVSALMEFPEHEEEGKALRRTKLLTEGWESLKVILGMTLGNRVQNLIRDVTVTVTKNGQRPSLKEVNALVVDTCPKGINGDIEFVGNAAILNLISYRDYDRLLSLGTTKTEHSGLTIEPQIEVPSKNYIRKLLKEKSNNDTQEILQQCVKGGNEKKSAQTTSSEVDIDSKKSTTAAPSELKKENGHVNDKTATEAGTANVNIKEELSLEDEVDIPMDEDELEDY